MLRADFFFFLRIILILTISIIFCRILCVKKKKKLSRIIQIFTLTNILPFVRSIFIRRETRVKSSISARLPIH